VKPFANINEKRYTIMWPGGGTRYTVKDGKRIGKRVELPPEHAKAVHSSSA